LGNRVASVILHGTLFHFWRRKTSFYSDFRLSVVGESYRFSICFGISWCNDEIVVQLTEQL